MPTCRCSHAGSNETYDLAFITSNIQNVYLYWCRKQRKLLCTYQSDWNRKKISTFQFMAVVINSSKHIYQIITICFWRLRKRTSQDERSSRWQREREGLLLLDIFMFDLKCVRNAAAEHRSQFGKRSYENNGKKAIQIK